MLRELYQSLNDKYPDPLPPGNSTWVWHSGRTKLYPVEQGLGFKGPLNSLNLKVCAVCCRTGDRVLIHSNEDQPMEVDLELLEIGLHFIGVRAHQRSVMRYCGEYVVGNLIFDNLSVGIYRGIHLEGALTMRNCVIDAVNPIRVYKRGTLKLEQCTFERASWGKTPMISISPWAHQVNVCKNKINGGYECRGIAIQRITGENENNDDLVRIKITDNVFGNVSKYAVAEIIGFDEQPQIIGTDRCILYGNTSPDNPLQPNTLLLFGE